MSASTDQDAGEETLRVLFLAAEADPFIKVGGLGDVAGSLPKALNHLPPSQNGGMKLDVRVVLPFHSGIAQKLKETPERIGTVTIEHVSGPVDAEIFTLNESGVPFYLVSGRFIEEGLPVYTGDNYRDGLKFTFTSLAALQLPRLLGWKPHILHANDWHTAMSVYVLAGLGETDAFTESTRTVLSVHNLPFLGAGAEPALQEFGILPSQDERLPEWARGMPLPLGLLTADQILAVSPQYAKEILTPDFGSGLHKFLQTRRESIGGILNGIDTSIWDPSQDRALAANYSVSDIPTRRINKTALQEEVGLPVDPDIPLLIFIGRMDPQKGIDLVIDGLGASSHLPWQLIMLGTGISALEDAARSLELSHPDRVRSIIRFDAGLAHRLYGGGDVILMPSRYEPCGLAQMIAMRYGCIPFARSTGGLIDTIRDQRTGPHGTGFLFSEPNPNAFAANLSGVIDVFHDITAWQALQRRAMVQDFSWEQSALSYAQTYSFLTRRML